LPSTKHLLEALSIQAVATAASGAMDLDEPRLLQNLEVTCCRGPAVLEVRREVTGGQLPAPMTEEEEQLAPRGMGEGVEDELYVLKGRR
jgi:hypothetical protein